MSQDKPLELLSTEELLREKIRGLAELDQEISKRDAVFLPTSYGLPDLLRPQREDESDEAFREWGDDTLVEFIESTLRIHKDGKAFDIQLFPAIVQIITDVFFRRIDRLILWKARGGGGSVAAAIIVFMCLIYHRMSFLNMSGSAKQAKAVFKHVGGFWDDVPELKRAILKSGHPLKSEMALLNGVTFEAVPASEKQARHQHLPGIVLDEAAQPEGSEIGDIMQTALEGAMSEPEHIILVVSTFHEPAGFYADLWDHAEERGFKRAKFDIWDSMIRCTEGLECATKTDPLALNYCRTNCPLTEKLEHVDEFGTVVGEEYIGCHGKARKSQGFQTWAQVVRAKLLNVGSDKFWVEFGCRRPTYKRMIYNPEVIDEQLLKKWVWDESPETSVGIDWGFSVQASVILVMRGRCPDDEKKRGLCIVEADFVQGELVGEMIFRLRRWHQEYGINFDVYADAENPYNNAELEAAGFNVIPVAFGAWKEFGIGNVSRWFGRRSLFILDEHRTLISQLKKYRRLPSGKPKKRDDHGPDAVLAAMMHFPFMDEFGEDGGSNWSPTKNRKEEMEGREVFLI